MSDKKKRPGCLVGAVGVIAILAIIIAAGGNNTDNNNADDSTDSKKSLILTVSTADSEKADDTAEISGDKADEEESKEAEEAEDTEGPKEPSFTVDEQVLWETDSIKLSVTGIDEDDYWGAAIKVLAENKSDRDITIGTDAIIVNDYMINDLTSISATAGNKSNDSITLFEHELEQIGIDTIGKVELYMHTSDSNSYDRLEESGCITITTSEYDNMDTTNNVDGATLYDQDGVKIVGKYVDEDSVWGQAALLYIENNTDQNIIVSCDDVAVNGFMINGVMSETIYAGKKAVPEITLFESDLEENGITDIETIEAEFSIRDEGYHEIANTGKVAMTVK